MRNTLLILCAVWQLVSLPKAWTQAEQPAYIPSLFEYLHSQTGNFPVWELDTDWSSLVRGKMNEKYQPGVLRFTHADGQNVQWDIRLRARGNMRKQVCHFPPVKIKLPKDGLSALGLNPDGNDLKMVLQCRSGSLEAEWLLKEWIAYQIYECISPAAYRTQLLQIQGREGGKEKVKLYAFLIEDADEMSGRIGARFVRQSTIRVSGLERETYVRMCFFQYMIANTDWSIPNRHNLGFIAAPQYSGIVPVPYDFDYSGLVQTSYAVPHESLPIKSVGERYFQGRNVTEEEALAAARFFISKRKEIIERCTTTSHLEDKTKKAVERFLVYFFEQIEDEKRVKRIFVTN